MSRSADPEPEERFGPQDIEERPPEGIGNRCPAELSRPSPRTYPERPRAGVYPDYDQIKRPQQSGQAPRKKVFGSQAQQESR
jgi:hypothetical protein